MNQGKKDSTTSFGNLRVVKSGNKWKIVKL